MPEDPSKIPSQELERQFNMLREITLKPVSSLPDGYGLRVRELKEEKVEGSMIESEESLSVLNDDVKKAAQKFNEAQDELKNYVKQLEKELKEKVEKKQASIKEAEVEYEAAKASVETVESARTVCEHFDSLLTNTDKCFVEMKDAFQSCRGCMSDLMKAWCSSARRCLKSWLQAKSCLRRSSRRQGLQLQQASVNRDRMNQRLNRRRRRLEMAPEKR